LLARSRSLPQIAGSSCLETEASAEGRGSCGTILRSLKGNYSNVRKIWTTRIHAHETCPSVVLNNEELNKVWQIKTKEKNILLQDVAYFVGSSPINLFCCHLSVSLLVPQGLLENMLCIWYRFCQAPERRWDFRPDNQLSGQSRIANKSRFVLWLV